MTTNRGLYIHIPFCIRKCAYCDFFSVALDTELASRYIEEVCNELSLLMAAYPDTVIDTVYLGGGTPSVLPQSLLERLIAHIYKCAHVEIKEFSIEVNPCSSDKLSFYPSLGINRVSIGVQALQAGILKAIGRLHTPQEALDALSRAARLFPDVSADIMLGLPMQTVRDVEETLKHILPYVTHVSQYMLKLSESVPMGIAVKEKRMILPDDDLTADMYDAGSSIMQQYAFERYEISNFARNKRDCMHNLKYWNRQEYIGLGAAAHSFIKGVRYENPSDMNAYLNGEHLGNGLAGKTDISVKDALFEYIMLKLRLEEGFEVAEINHLFHIDFNEKYKEEIGALIELLDFNNGRIRIKKEKMLLESYVAKKFLK
ncbi:MAG: radical SAM family heme chaperone HemW [Clostridia bacterium]|nr:radical SAM family heme chaperone HemW [Clostridia bacterium]